MPDLSYDLFCVTSRRKTYGHFVELYMKRGLKVNVSKRKVMMLNGEVLGGEEGSECEVCVDEMQLIEACVRI